MEFLLAVEFFDVGQLPAVQQSFADHVDRQVGQAVGNQRVGHGHGGHAVDDAFAQVGHEFVELLRQEHFGRVGRLQTGEDDVEILVQAALEDDVVEVGDRSGDVARYAVSVVALTHLFGESAAAQVEVDDDYLLVGQGERHGQVRRDEGLARMGIRRGDHDDLQLARLDAHEAQVRTDQPECLRDAVGRCRAPPPIPAGSNRGIRGCRRGTECSVCPRCPCGRGWWCREFPSGR